MQERKNFKDQLLTCCECGETFTFSEGEAFFFWSKGLNQPKRCKKCRRQRKLTIPEPGGAL